MTVKTSVLEAVLLLSYFSSSTFQYISPLPLLRPPQPTLRIPDRGYSVRSTRQTVFTNGCVLAEAGKGPASTDSYDNPNYDQIGYCSHALPCSTSREMAALCIKPHSPAHLHSLLISPSYVCIISQRQQLEWTRFQWSQVGTPISFNFSTFPNSHNET